MCDIGTLQTLLIAASAAVIAATVAIGVAAVLNNGFFSAPGSPAFMITAGALTLIAVASLGAANALAQSYFECMGSPEACAGALSNLLNVLAGLITTLGIQATACFVAAGIAWIPWGGQAPMYVILAALIVQAALIPTAIAFATQFINCVEASTISESSFPLIASALSGAIAFGLVYLLNSRDNKD